MEKEYAEAINEAKKSLKSKDTKEIHRHLTNANKIKSKIKQPEHKIDINFNIGDNVKYRKKSGTIINLKDKNATIEVEGMTLKVPLIDLKHITEQKKSKQNNIKIDIGKPKKASIKLDLHGMRGEEAIEKLDKFISDALLSGFDEIIVYHGIGLGILSKLVKEFLLKHPSIKNFIDAPPSMGGFGAKIIQL